MFTYGTRSRQKLDTCHSDLVTIAELALDVSPYDIAIIHGWRGEELQNSLVDSGVSRTRWPESKHNYILDGEPYSLAIDFAPWVDGAIPWNDTHIFAVIAGVMFAVAEEVGISITWGGDWDGDGSTKDQTLMDWGHIQLEV